MVRPVEIAPRVKIPACAGMTRGEAGMTGENRNDAGGGDLTAEGSNDSVVCRTDGGGMSRDVFPHRIRVTVIVMIRVCANAEIGVPRGRIACPRRHPCTHRHLRTHCCLIVYLSALPYNANQANLTANSAAFPALKNKEFL